MVRIWKNTTTVDFPGYCTYTIIYSIYIDVHVRKWRGMGLPDKWQLHWAEFPSLVKTTTTWYSEYIKINESCRPGTVGIWRKKWKSHFVCWHQLGPWWMKDFFHKCLHQILLDNRTQSMPHSTHHLKLAQCHWWSACLGSCFWIFSNCSKELRTKYEDITMLHYTHSHSTHSQASALINELGSYPVIAYNMYDPGCAMRASQNLLCTHLTKMCWSIYPSTFFAWTVSGGNRKLTSATSMSATKARHTCARQSIIAGLSPVPYRQYPTTMCSPKWKQSKSFLWKHSRRIMVKGHCLLGRP